MTDFFAFVGSLKGSTILRTIATRMEKLWVLKHVPPCQEYEPNGPIRAYDFYPTTGCCEGPCERISYVRALALDAARNEALEEAAKVTEDDICGPDYLTHQDDCHYEIKKAIRALAHRSREVKL